MHIGRKHTRLLKKIDRKGVVRKDKRFVEDLQYLYDQGLIHVVSCPKEDDFYFEAYALSEKGKAVLDERILHYRDRRVPYVALVLSILSIIVSLAALALQLLQFLLSTHLGH